MSGAEDDVTEHFRLTIEIDASHGEEVTPDDALTGLVWAIRDVLIDQGWSPDCVRADRLQTRWQPQYVEERPDA